MENIPVIKLGLVAVSRDCFPIALSEKRRAAIAAICKAKKLNFVEIKTTVENEKDMLKAVEELKANECNAACVFLGNFGPETPETLIAKYFDGPCMFVAAAEGDGDLINGRGDAYCGMLNCSYNLGMRHLKGYIPEYPVGTAEELGDKIAEFIPIARVIVGLKNLKIITFGPRPQDFFACNAPIKGLYELGIEIEENSELDLLVSYKEHANDSRIPAICEDMKKRGSPVGVTTVYRQLERLAGEGLVHRYVSFPGESACYAYIGERGTAVSPCYHFKCERCGRLLHIKCAELTNFREQALTGMGLSYEQLKTRFPRLIHAGVLGYGAEGPDKDRPGYDYTAFFSRSRFTTASGARFRAWRTAWRLFRSLTM